MLCYNNKFIDMNFWSSFPSSSSAVCLLFLFFWLFVYLFLFYKKINK